MTDAPTITHSTANGTFNELWDDHQALGVNEAIIGISFPFCFLKDSLSKRIGQIAFFILLCGIHLGANPTGEGNENIDRRILMIAQVALLGNLLLSITKITQKLPEKKSHFKLHFLPADLRQCSAIPSCFSEFDCFSKYICPIGGTPIRDPVRDPHDNQIYERENLARAISLNPLSPLTRLPLRIEEMLECPKEKQEIDLSLHLVSLATRPNFKIIKKLTQNN